MARWSPGGGPTRRRCASAMRCSVAAVTGWHSLRGIVGRYVTAVTVPTALRPRRARPSGAAGEIVKARGRLPSGGGAGAGAGAAAAVVDGALRVRPVAATAAGGRHRRTGAVGAGAGAEATATAAEGRAAGRNTRESG